METLPLVLLILGCFMVFVCILQTVLNRAVWWVYLWSVPVLFILWVLTWRGVIG